MEAFIQIDDLYVNVRYVKYIAKVDDENSRITMHDGEEHVVHMPLGKVFQQLTRASVTVVRIR